MYGSKWMLACFISLLTLSHTAEAKLYKWVDDDGNTHYGESIPPEYAAKDKDQTNQGNRSKNIEILSPEKIRAKEEEAAKKAAAKKEQEDKRKRDLALLNTYSSEKEIDMARDRSLAIVNARIESNNLLLKSSQNTLADLNGELADRKKEGRTIPRSLLDDMALAEAKVAKYQAEKSRNEEALLGVQERFENDKALYRKIIVTQPANAAQARGYNEAEASDDYPVYPEHSRRGRAYKSRRYD